MRYEEFALEKAHRLALGGHATIMGVESSCDETAVAIVADGRRVLSGVIASQIDVHALYGGVVPEIASRAHVSALDPLADAALAQAKLTSADIDAVAVANGPGLVGALLTGVSWAKAFAYAIKAPLIPVNHIEAHVSANYVAHPDLEPPFVALVASGGHSHILLVEGYGRYKLIGRTTDDAAGEAFDKVARVLKLPYPGGPLLDRLAEEGDDAAYKFPHIATEGRYDLSFSGLKTAAVNMAHSLEQKGEALKGPDFAASFRRAVVAQLADRAFAACEDTGARVLALAGGVASNTLLRRVCAERGARLGIDVRMPPPKLCTDNAVMAASAGYYNLMRGLVADLTLNAQPSLRLE